jgi:hypothetical protein
MISLAAVQPIVDAVLYEGYILYPYRPTSDKNRQRWTFGGIYPQVYFDATGGAEPCHMQTQCLIEGDADTKLEVRVRFLQPAAREVGKLKQPLQSWPDNDAVDAALPAFEPVASLVLGDKQYYSWQEAMERDVAVADCRLGALLDATERRPFNFGDGREIEPITDDAGVVQGVIVHRHSALDGHVELAAEQVADNIYRLTVRVENHTRMDPATIDNREQASLHSFASTHTILGVEGGHFLSLMDPPDALADIAAACDNQGAYPILVGDPRRHDTLLSSPIILYDYPEIAPESPGDLYDGTEIDELLSLSILAMTDAEKREMAATDARGAALLKRTEALTGEDFMRMHGVLRQPKADEGLGTGDWGLDGENNTLEPATADDHNGPRLAYYSNDGSQLKVGDRVRLRPKPNGDVWDMVLKDKTAVVEGIERDFEDKIHVAVAIDDDPGREWGMQRMPGHRFFFSLDEVEPLEQAEADREARA